MHSYAARTPANPTVAHRRRRVPVPTRTAPQIQPSSSSCACGGGCPRCSSETVGQSPTLRVSHPGDASERAADRMADAVMQSSRPAQTDMGTTDAQVTRHSVASTGPAHTSTGVVQGALQTTGQPLDTQARNFFEPRFGQDFSAVRVHTGSAASASARALSAEAYTIGRDIVFADGRYDTHTPAGRRLLAHELSHVVQQKQGQSGTAQVMRQTTIVVDNLGCPREKCAGKEDGIKADLRHALAYTAQALSTLQGKPSGNTERLLDWYFSDHSEGTAKTVRKRLGCIQAALQDTLDNDRYGCGTRTWAHAHTGGSDTLCEDSQAPVCLDPSYFTKLSARERAEALVHECGHRIGLSSGTPDIYSHGWRFLSLSTQQALMNTDSYALFVGASALGARTTWMPLFGVGGGLTSLGGLFLKIRLGAEAQHPKLRAVNPSAGVSFSTLDGEVIGSLFLGARLANARPGHKGSVYLSVTGELSFIGGDSFAVGAGAEAALGYRIGHFDIGVVGSVLRDPSPDAGTRTVYSGGLRFTFIPEFWSK